MNEAWPSTSSLTINMNFEKFYCTKAFIGVKFEQIRAKNVKLAKQQFPGRVCQLAL